VIFLLDTNVISEWVKPRPDPDVVSWLADADEDRTFLSVITLAEIREGIERLANGARRKRLDEWLRHELPLRFDGRIVPVDTTVADAWGKVVARRAALGKSIGIMDAFIAATAEVHDMTLVTRNVEDFKSSVKTIVNPWSRS
jgi:predicted nucleic acid-binding protein